MGELEQEEAGFAAVDALTALVILSITIALSIGALARAREIQKVAAESNAARTTLQLILAEPSRAPGSYAGVSGAFDWTLLVNEESAPSAPLRVCAQKAGVQPRQGRRHYELETRRPCPPDVRQP